MGKGHCSRKRTVCRRHRCGEVRVDESRWEERHTRMNIYKSDRYIYYILRNACNTYNKWYIGLARHGYVLPYLKEADENPIMSFGRRVYITKHNILLFISHCKSWTNVHWILRIDMLREVATFKPCSQIIFIFYIFRLIWTFAPIGCLKLLKRQINLCNDIKEPRPSPKWGSCYRVGLLVKDFDQLASRL